MQKPVYKYRPALTLPEDLKKTLVGRKEILQRLLKTLKEAPKAKGLQHFLLIGPRGAGKTHLLLLIYHTIKGDIQWPGISNLNRYWVPVLFAEEEYGVTSLTELLLIALEKIQDETGWSDALEIHTRISKISIPAKTECEKILDFLIQKRKKENKRFLLLLDNIHDTLPLFTEEDQGRLRDILMSQDIFMLIGAAPTIFDTVAEYDKPFYNFFEILGLNDISEEEIEELIRRRLKMDGRKKYLEQFEQIRYRVKAIVHLTGGNPRLVLSLYEIFVEDRMLEVEKSLLNLLDELTPYFQDRMKDIPSQQRKILDAITLLDGPSTPVEISRMSRLPVNIVTAQLAKLKQAGYVRVRKEKGKKIALYDVSDRLFRLWRQMSVEAGRRRLTIIVKFLEVWFSPEELAERIIETVREMKTALTKGEIAKAKEMTEKLYYYQEAAQVPSKTFAHWQRVWGLIGIGNMPEAEAEVERLFKAAHKKKDKDLLAQAFWEKAFLSDRKQDMKSVIATLTEYLKLKPRHANAWYNMGNAYANLKQYEKAIECYNKAVEIKPDMHEALNNIGNAYAGLKQYEKAIECYNKAVEIKPNKHEALNNMGNAYAKLKQYDKSIECYTEAINQASASERGFYLFNRGNALRRANKWKLVLKDGKEAFSIAQKLGIESLKGDSAASVLGSALLLSKRNVFRGNKRKAMEYLEDGVSYLPEVPSKPIQQFLGTYFKDLLVAREITFTESALKLVMEKGDENLRQFLKPYDDAIRYYHTRDRTILNRLFPEIREIVEQIVAKLETKD